MGMYPDSPRLAIDFEKLGEDGRSRTKQSMRDETDINNVIKRFTRSGLLTYVNEKSPVYLDVSGMSDYRTALDHVREADKFFAGLPSKIRTRFNNDAAQFLDFMSDDRNEAEARELGLAKELPKEPVGEVPGRGVQEVPKKPVDEVPGPGVQHRGPDGRFESPK